MISAKLNKIEGGILEENLLFTLRVDPGLFLSGDKQQLAEKILDSLIASHQEYCHEVCLLASYDAVMANVRQ